jgi:hypothetical protein
MSDPALTGVPCDPADAGWGLGERVVARHAWGFGLRAARGFVTGARYYAASGDYGLEIGDTLEDVGKAHPMFPQFTVGQLWSADLCHRR